MIRGVDAPRLRVDLFRQFVGVSGFEFRQTAMLQNKRGEFMPHFREFFQHVFGGGGLPFWGFARRGHAQFAVENFPQLLG